MSQLENTSKEPSDTALHQQRIQAWHPVLDPIAVAITFTALAAIFIPVGIKLKVQSDSIVELKNRYDAFNVTTNCSITQSNENRICDISFTVDKDMDAPVLVYYEVENFHQNHRRYINSRDDNQLLGSLSQTSLNAEFCAPLNKLGNITINPCGLVANTLFNDVISFTSGKDADGNNLTMREDGIAWRSDVDFKFQQPDGFRYEQCQDCNSCVCQQPDWSCATPYVDDEGKCYRYYYPNDNMTQYLYETYPMVVNPIEGVTNEHFIVWMRVAAAPTFRKMYGYFNQPISKGEVLFFQIKANWDVKSFKGAKSLILSTTSPFGGRNPSLSYSFLAVGGYCLVAAIFIFLKQMIRPRKLADPKHLKYKDI